MDISKTLGVTEDAAKTLLKIVGEDANIPDDKLAEALTKVAGDYKRLQAQVAALNPDNPTARTLVDEAKPEIDAGHFERAHELLRQATQAQIAAAQEARKLKEQAQAAEDAQMLGAASSTAAEGDVALTERRYLEAADLFGQAAGYVPSGHASEQGGYLLRQADALYRQGDERGDNAALRSSIEVYGRALADYPRERGSARLGADAEQSRQCARRRSASGRAGRRGSRRRWRPIAPRWRRRTRAAGSARLGADAEQSRQCAREAWRAGERDGRLEEAVAAYRAALEESTRERVPLEWARTQEISARADALGNTGRRSRPIAPRSRSGRASGFRSNGRRRRTISAMRSWRSASGRAGRRGSRRRSPPIARRSRNVRASGFRSTGRDADQSRQCALEARRAGERDGAAGGGGHGLSRGARGVRASGFRSTGRRRSNLGDALMELGERESGTARLEEAIAAYRAALEENTRERVPLEWAMTQNNLGNALLRLGERESGTARLEEAVAAYRAALEERTRERVPLDWAMTQMNLGLALETLGERESVTAWLTEAVAADRAALEENTRERVPLQWAKAQHGLGNALAALAERQKNARLMEEAVKAMSGAVDVYRQAGESYWLPIAQQRVTKMQAELTALRGSRR